MKRLISRIRMMATPQVILAVIFILILGYLVFVPLIVIISETFIVHPIERFQIPGSRAGDFTWHHWRQMFLSSNAYSQMYKPFVNTLIIASSLGVLSLLIGGILAWLVVRTDMPFKKFISNLAIIPYIMPSWTMTLAWITMFKNRRIGGAPGLFEALTGIQLPNWLSYGMIPIIICLTVHYVPFGFMLIGGALKSLDSQLEESAELLGASRRQIFQKIVMPLMLPVILTTFLLTFTRGFGTFAAPTFLGGPVRLYVLSTTLHANLIAQRQGNGYIIALVMMVIGALILYMDHKLIGARKSFVTISGKGGQSGLVRLGKNGYVVAGFVILCLLCVTLVPFVVMAIDSFMLVPGQYSFSNLTLHYWIGEARPDIGWGASLPGILRDPLILRAFANSFRLAFSTALICGISGMLIGYTVVRLRGTRVSQFLSQISFVPYLMPSIAFGSIYLALFATQRGPIPSLYGSFTLLIIACSVKYLPFASRSGVAAMMQIGPELEEAAIMVKANWFQRIGRIIIPIQKNAFFSGLILPFISAMRELSLIILLVTPGTQLATSVILRYTERGLYVYTNAVMIIIITVVLLTTILSRKIMGTDLAKGIGA